MATLDQVLAVAEGEVGYSRWDDPNEGTKYGRWCTAATGYSVYAQSGVPYCAMFVSYCFRMAGDDYPGGIFVYCPTGINQGVSRGLDVSVADCQRGDVVFFDWDDDGISDHVGFVLSNNGWSISTVEGNTNDGAVAYKTRYYSDVCAVIRPPYDGSASDWEDDDEELYVDGEFGPRSVRRAQELAGTTKDGEISGQDVCNRPYHVALKTVKYDDGTDGSPLVGAIQRALGVEDDEHLGPNTIAALQRSLGTVPDSYLGAITASAWQRRLNDGHLV